MSFFGVVLIATIGNTSLFVEHYSYTKQLNVLPRNTTFKRQIKANDKTPI